MTVEIELYAKRKVTQERRKGRQVMMMVNDGQQCSMMVKYTISIAEHVTASPINYVVNIN